MATCAPSGTTHVAGPVLQRVSHHYGVSRTRRQLRPTHDRRQHVMAKVIVVLSMSLDGFIAGANDGSDQPLGRGGMRLFDWYFDGDTPIREYQAAAARSVSVPPFKLSRSSAEVFEELIESGGAAVTGRRTYDIADAWGGNGPMPGLPLFVVTHHVPDQVPHGASQYTFVTDGVESAITQAK